MRFLLSIALLLLSLTGFSQQYYLFVGTYTDGPSAEGSKGIYVYTFDAATGDLKPVSTIATQNPSYLTIAPGGKFVYAVGETHGATPGSVSAFSFDKTTGKLTFIDKQLSGGADPCYVTVDAHRKWAMVANYSGGNFSALPIAADGSLQPATETIQHTGAGGNKNRQDKAHVHSTILSPDEKYLVVCDLGMDNLSVLHFNPAATKQPLTNATDSVVTLQPGVGPRHSAFVPGKPYAYVIDELTGTVDAFHYSNGKFTPIQHISSLPDGFKGDIGSADIHVSPNGKFLYASNRGDANSIVIYAIDATTGKLTVKGFQSTMGKTPRNFMIDPTGHWLLAANQNGKNVVIFKIDQQTGMLTPTGKQLEIPAPVCLKMTPVK
ncbi:lactonase family protein [Puia dinghuensis]|uniref:3-carboxymuconate cyclase n=1 Tax=Puia dinghuensis TaxID=1792502 RepID=A0A8J2U9D3_9BACT|nr:lactonase family protein [Puia dinghuensis]GGA87427.1 3-carboxymuconate cyclase [Puia dinghuensis]